jgi:PBSX family phage portal protein
LNKKPFGIVTKTADHFQYVNQSIMDSYSQKSEDGTSSSQLEDDFKKGYGKNNLHEPPYSPHLFINLLEMNTYHARCVKTKARDSGGLGWKMEPLDDEGSKQEMKDMEELKSVLKRQSSPISKTAERGIVDFDSIGYCTWEFVRQNEDATGKIVSIHHVPAHTIRLHKSRNKFLQQRGNKKLWFKRAGYEMDVHKETGEEHEMNTLDKNKRARELVMWSDYTPKSVHYGLPAIVPAIGAIHGDISRRDYNIAFFENYGVPSYAVFVTGNFEMGEVNEETGQTEFEEAIEDHFKELAKNPHSALVLSVPSKEGEGEVNIEFKPLSVETKEASFRLYRQDNRDEILSAHGVPPYRVGISETGNMGGTTARESTEIYKESVIRPRQEWIEEMFNRFILTSWGIEHFEFKLNQIDTSDEKHDVEILTFLVDNGAATPNQLIRHFGERFGLQEVDHPAMNSHYIKGNPIDNVLPAETEEVPEGDAEEIEIPDEGSGEGSDEMSVVVANALNGFSGELEKATKTFDEYAREYAQKKKGWF